MYGYHSSLQGSPFLRAVACGYGSLGAGILYVLLTSTGVTEARPLPGISCVMESHLVVESASGAPA